MFAGEQRAIGELMIREGPRPLECMGYAEFLSEVRTQEDVLLNALRAVVRRLGDELLQARLRLAALQHLLIDLLASLDPKYVRFPEDRRTEV
jgi:hypothetical protein